MRLILYLLVCSTFLGAINAQTKSNETFSDEIRIQTESTLKALEGVHAKLSTERAQLSKLEKRTDLLEGDKTKIAGLTADVQKAQIEALASKADLEIVKNSLTKNNASVEDLKKQIVQLQTQTGSLNDLTATAQKLSKAVEEFKAFTSMNRNAERGSIGVGLEARRDGKKIPLSGKRVTVSLQHKDGPLEKLMDVTTDSDGVARIARPNVRDRPYPMFAIFGFSGDDTNRSCSFRIPLPK